MRSRGLSISSFYRGAAHQIRSDAHEHPHRRVRSAGVPGRGCEVAGCHAILYKLRSAVEATFGSPYTRHPARHPGFSVMATLEMLE